MISEPTGRELELHNYLLAHGVKQISNVAHALPTPALERCLPNEVTISALFWSEKHQQEFWCDTILSCDLLDDSDLPIKVLAGFVLRQAVGIDEAGPPLR